MLKTAGAISFAITFSAGYRNLAQASAPPKPKLPDRGAKTGKRLIEQKLSTASEGVNEYPRAQQRSARGPSPAGQPGAQLARSH